ncbi:alpha/beta fold hydrolase [Luteolibacter ambystomatis]|uniref:Alpha/beta fold hydrolase n=1 Tax=Luteolibacter ambystomatis TaxID=2824561 RepID=A0A975PG15_9BACT|nr:alpha/beta fold hydrolase [Luteolibacter ambystomatis]QUE52374.1 alpha/beta fold hydrolase [Luteolibacter ambystomatis]
MKRLLSLLALVSGLLLPSCVPSLPATETGTLKDGRARVVFVHGIFQNGNLSFGLLRHRLEEKGIACYAPSLKPADAHEGMEKLAEQLKAGIDRQYGPKERISIVGFSMGGLVARYYLQELGGAARCDALYTVATPHHGTQTARFYGGKGSNELLPGSEFLKNLDQSQDRLGRMPIVSYRSPYDLVILPHDSCVWKRAENVEVSVLAHPLMTRAAPVVDDIERRITASLKPAASH